MYTHTTHIQPVLSPVLTSTTIDDHNCCMTSCSGSTFQRERAVQARSHGAPISAEPSTEIPGRLLCSSLRRCQNEIHALPVDITWLCRATVRTSSVAGPMTWTHFQMISAYWIGLSSVLQPHQHSIGYMGDGFYRSKDPTNSIKVQKEQIVHRQIKHTISRQ